jgi:hypothetical protein
VSFDIEKPAFGWAFFCFALRQLMGRVAATAKNIMSKTHKIPYLCSR